VIRQILLFGAMSALSLACARPTSPAPSRESARGAPREAPSSSPAEVLARMDSRKGLPLLPMMADHQKQNMREHLAAVQEIIGALATDNFTRVESAARLLGFSEEMGRMCTHMGSGAPGFSERALAFHRTADGIAVAARQRDKASVLKQLGATLEACTSCHATWKQQVVDEATWETLTAAVPATHDSPHSGPQSGAGTEEVP